MYITVFVTELRNSAFRLLQWKPLYLYCALGQSNSLADTCSFCWCKRRISLTTNQHGADGEDLFCVCVSRDIPKPNAGEAAEGEVQRCNIGTSDGRAPQGIVAIVWRLQSFSQLMKPTCHGRKKENLSPKSKLPVLARGGNDK